MFRKKTAEKKTGTSRKLFTVMLLLIMVFSLAPGASAAQKKKGNKVQNNRYNQKKVTAGKLKGKKKGSSGKPQKDRPVRVAVVDRTQKAAAGMMRWARYCGMTPVFVNSRKVRPEKFDGLLVPGGGDVDPRIYGAKKRDSHTYGTDYARSYLQVKVIQKFAEAGKPVLGICGGEQTINVAFGGTLKQHIGWHTGRIPVSISKKSWLYGMFGDQETVVHFHHQCVNKVGKDLVATMWGCDNGEIEAVEHKTLPVYGVQWHPDQMGGTGKQIGQMFMSICRKYR